jgi:hypothetical protein
VDYYDYYYFYNNDIFFFNDFGIDCFYAIIKCYSQKSDCGEFDGSDTKLACESEDNGVIDEDGKSGLTITYNY